MSDKAFDATTAITSLPHPVPHQPISWQIIHKGQNASQPLRFEPLDCNGDGQLDLIWWLCQHFDAQQTHWYICRKEIDLLQNGKIQLAYAYDWTGKLEHIEKDMDGDGFVDNMPASPWTLPQHLPDLILLPQVNATPHNMPTQVWGCHRMTSH